VPEQYPYQTGKEKVPEDEIQYMCCMFRLIQIFMLKGKESYVGVNNKIANIRLIRRNLRGEYLSNISIIEAY